MTCCYFNKDTAKNIKGYLHRKQGSVIRLQYINTQKLTILKAKCHHSMQQISDSYENFSDGNLIVILTLRNSDIVKYEAQIKR